MFLFQAMTFVQRECAPVHIVSVGSLYLSTQSVGMTFNNVFVSTLCTSTATTSISF